MSSPGYPTPVSPPAGPADNAHDGSAALVESLIGQPVGRLEYRDALVRFEQAAAELNGFGVDTLTPIDMLAVLERREAVRRAEAIIDHRIIARLAAETNPRELGAKSLPELLSTRCGSPGTKPAGASRTPGSSGCAARCRVSPCSRRPRTPPPVLSTALSAPSTPRSSGTSSPTSPRTRSVSTNSTAPKHSWPISPPTTPPSRPAGSPSG